MVCVEDVKMALNERMTGRLYIEWMTDFQWERRREWNVGGSGLGVCVWDGVMC